MPDVQGVIVPTVSPLAQDGSFDAGSSRRLARHLSQAGVDGIFALGLTGEAYDLPDQARSDAMRAALGLAHERRDLAILIGATAGTVGQTIANLRRIDHPAQGAVLQPSYHESECSLDSLLGRAERATGAPIFLYCNPATARAWENVTPEELVRVSCEHPIVRGVKVSDKRARFQQYCAAPLKDGMRLYIGSANDMFAIVREDRPQRTPAGVVSGPANAYPLEWVRAWRALRAGTDTSPFEAFFAAFSEFYNGIPSGKNTVAAIKYVLWRQGVIDSPRCAARNLLPTDRTHLEEGYDRLERMRAELN